MAVDVARVIEQYEDRAAAVPMHGQSGQVRRAPSTDQKRVRRQQQMTKRAFTDLPDAELMALASHCRVSDTERGELLHEVELRRSAALARRDDVLDQIIAGAQIRDTIIPGLVHDRSTPATDWLVDLAPRYAQNHDEVEHTMAVHATLWFESVHPAVKAYGPEFAEQARGMGSRLASQHVDDYEHALNVFLTRAEVLWHQGARTGAFTRQAILPLLAAVPEIAEAGAAALGAGEAAGGAAAAGAGAAEGAGAAGAAEAGEGAAEEAGGGFADRAKDWAAKGLRHELNQGGGTSNNDNSSGGGGGGDDLGGSASDYADQVTQHSSARRHRADRMYDLDDEDLPLVDRPAPKPRIPVLPDFNADTAATMHWQHGEDTPPMTAPVPGSDAVPISPARQQYRMVGGDKPLNRYLHQQVHSHAQPVQPQPAQKVASMTSTHDADIALIFGTKLAASTLPQVGEQGLPTDAFAQSGYPDVNTSSMRSPTLQDLAANHGLNDPSLNVGPDGQQADHANPPGGFPVSGSAQRADAVLARTASQKENNRMDHTASCPTCSGTGSVAVRQVTAYSGLPQIDQIVNADETQSETPLPPNVAFPITWDVNSVPNAITQAEQFIGERNAKSPLMAQGAFDESGWASNAPMTPAPGGKTWEPPGYSMPEYGSTDMGYADPAYGNGGDQAPRQGQPHGAQEVNDETNVPHEQYGPVGPYNNDEGYREVSPGMATTGRRDPYIAAAQQEILRQQAIIARRSSQL